jgi:hypothetical protein
MFAAQIRIANVQKIVGETHFLVLRKLFQSRSENSRIRTQVKRRHQVKRISSSGRNKENSGEITDENDNY